MEFLSVLFPYGLFLIVLMLHYFFGVGKKGFVSRNIINGVIILNCLTLVLLIISGLLPLRNIYFVSWLQYSISWSWLITLCSLFMINSVKGSSFLVFMRNSYIALLGINVLLFLTMPILVLFLFEVPKAFIPGKNKVLYQSNDVVVERNRELLSPEPVVKIYKRDGVLLKYVGCLGVNEENSIYKIIAVQPLEEPQYKLDYLNNNGEVKDTIITIY